MSESIKELQPNKIWKYFSELCAIPRGSKKEEMVIAYMKAFGESLGLETIVEDIGNVIIKKDATPGMENKKVTVLQGHIDMVHQKNSDVSFDFDKDGIKAYIDDGWVTAEGTTLGADNGIGVSSAMAILASNDIPHPPLEALFTIDEETGMTGAINLSPNNLSGKVLLNLDSEEDDELTIGCAGGVNTTANMKYKEEKLKGKFIGYELSVTGLKGGHSGIDIHLGRGNANKILNRFLFNTKKNPIMRLASIDGGGLRNAIPREAKATFAVPKKKNKKFAKQFNARRTEILEEYKHIEPDMLIELKEIKTPKKVMSEGFQKKLTGAIAAVFNGVFRMTPDIPGLVETSSNLARVLAKKGKLTIQSLQRSSIESGKLDVVNTIKAALDPLGAKLTNDSDYPGWPPATESEILTVMQQSYENLFGEQPKVLACHAGLECGIIGKQYPEMDMISFGPEIRNPHSPDEKINIESVGKFWTLLLDVLKNIPEN
jgi:dipeptidase D